MNTALILCGFVGVVMLVVGLAMIVPELAIDSPLDLLITLAKGGFLLLVHDFIREGWPETKVAGFLYYGGLFFIGVAGLVFGLRAYLAELS